MKTHLVSNQDAINDRPERPGVDEDVKHLTNALMNAIGSSSKRLNIAVIPIDGSSFRMVLPTLTESSLDTMTAARITVTAETLRED